MLVWELDINEIMTSDDLMIYQAFPLLHCNTSVYCVNYELFFNNMTNISRFCIKCMKECALLVLDLTLFYNIF